MILSVSKNKFLVFLLSATTSNVANGIVNFETCLASDTPSSFKDLTMISRIYVPYGLDQLNPSCGKDGCGNYGYGYGMGALESVAYDYKEKYLYGSSEQGQITVTDFSDPKNPTLLPSEYMIDVGGVGGMQLTDIEVCAEKNILMVSRLTFGTGGPGDVILYRALKRTEDSEYPENYAAQLMTIPVGAHPDMIKPNPTCDKLAVANEGEGKYDDELGLIDALGSVTLIESSLTPPTFVDIPLNKWTDDELISKGVHLPLSKNALIYWNTYSAIADKLNFDNAINTYSTAQNLEPECITWSADSKYLYVTLQENSAIVTIDVDKKEAVDILPLRLKDWSKTSIDVFKDGGCDKIKPVSDLYSAPMPDSIESVVIDGMTYLLTADEGDHKIYGSYVENVEARDLFSGDAVKGVSPSFDCNASGKAKDICNNGLQLTVGSSAVNYDDPTAPIIEKIVAFGGRGISIFKAKAAKVKPIWNSGSEFEEAVCKKNPWAHNSAQDEGSSPVDGALYNTTNDYDFRLFLEKMSDPNEDGCDDQGDGTPGVCPLSETVDARSWVGGPDLEAIVTGAACGRLFAVTSCEKGGSAFLYDITDIKSPFLAKTFHLTPASKDLSAGLAYDLGELGEVDAESVLFLDESKSPSGNPAIIFAGSWSGTVSFWDFNCADDFVPKTKCEKNKNKKKGKNKNKKKEKKDSKGKNENKGKNDNKGKNEKKGTEVKRLMNLR